MDCICIAEEDFLSEAAGLSLSWMESFVQKGLLVFYFTFKK